MAMVPRTVPVPVTGSAIQTPRAHAATRPFASEPKTVEELSPQVEVQSETNGRLSNEYGYPEWRLSDNNRSDVQRDIDPLNLVVAPTKLFADIFSGDEDLGSAGKRNLPLPEVHGHTNLVSKAINTYETTAKVIGGQIHDRGAALSFLL